MTFLVDEETTIRLYTSIDGDKTELDFLLIPDSKHQSFHSVTSKRFEDSKMSWSR